MLLVGASDRVVALWSDAPGSVTSVAVPSDGAATDMLGSPIPLSSEGGTSSVTIGEVAGPVFLTFPNPGVLSDGGADGAVDASPGPADGQAGTPADASPDGSGGGSSSHASSGCGCYAIGPDAGGLSLAGLGGALWVLVLRRRRPPRSRSSRTPP
jgi:hypothetical protein